MPNNSSLSIVRYQTGSYLIVENQPNSKENQGSFFIIRSGKVRVETMVDQMLGSQQHVLGGGGFFGVISAMSAQESNETAVALSDCSLIMVKSSKFGDLVMEAPSIALKIIRSLSNDLRHYDNELALRMEHEENENDVAESLFHAGTFFYRVKNYDYAAKIFFSYIENYPEGKSLKEANKYFNDMNLKVDSPSGFSRSYPNGAMICAEYMPGSELYIIQSGKIKITKIINEQEIILAILDAGEIVGEMSLLNNKTRTANVIAYGEAKIMAVNKDNFEKVILQNKELATKLLTVLSDRLWTIYKQLANLLIEDPLTRLLDTLLTQLLKQHIVLDRGAKYQFAFGKAELLKMCALPSELGDDAFEELLRYSFMNVKADGLYCSNLEELHKTVESAHKIEIRARKIRKAKERNS